MSVLYLHLIYSIYCLPTGMFFPLSTEVVMLIPVLFILKVCALTLKTLGTGYFRSQLASRHWTVSFSPSLLVANYWLPCNIQHMNVRTHFHSHSHTWQVWTILRISSSQKGFLIEWAINPPIGASRSTIDSQGPLWLPILTVSPSFFFFLSCTQTQK